MISGAEVAIQGHVSFLTGSTFVWERCPAAVVGLSWRRALMAWDSSCRAERRCDRAEIAGWMWEGSSRHSPGQCEGLAALAGASPGWQ